MPSTFSIQRKAPRAFFVALAIVAAPAIFVALVTMAAVVAVAPEAI